MGTQAKSVGSLVLCPGLPFNGVKVFSATLFADRGLLGDRVTQWMADHPHVQVTEMTVTQSSDASFHCVAITVFYREQKRPTA